MSTRRTLAQLEPEIASLARERKRADHNITFLEREQAHKRRVLQGVDPKLNAFRQQMEAAIANIQREIEELQREKEEVNVRIDRLKRKLVYLLQQQIDITADIEKTTRFRNEQSKKIRDQRKKCKRFDLSVKHLKGEVDKTKAERQQKDREFQAATDPATCTAIRFQLMVLDRRLRTQQQALTTRRVEAAATTTKLESLMRERTRKNTVLKTLRARLVAIKKQLELCREKLTQLRKRRMKLIRRILRKRAGMWSLMWKRDRARICATLKKLQMEKEMKALGAEIQEAYSIRFGLTAKLQALESQQQRNNNSNDEQNNNHHSNHHNKNNYRYN